MSKNSKLTKEQKKRLKDIKNALISQRFYDFYINEDDLWVKYISYGEKELKEEVDAELVRMFNL